MRRIIPATILALAGLAAFAEVSHTLAAGQVKPEFAERRGVTIEQVNRWETDLSNWGRWGKNDERGALNLITPAKEVQRRGW